MPLEIFRNPVLFKLSQLVIVTCEEGSITLTLHADSHSWHLLSTLGTSWVSFQRDLGSKHRDGFSWPLYKVRALQLGRQGALGLAPALCSGHSRPPGPRCLGAPELPSRLLPAGVFCLCPLDSVHASCLLFDDIFFGTIPESLILTTLIFKN